MSFEIADPDKAVDLTVLNTELAALKLAGFRGSARLSRRPNDAGVWEATDRYILVKCDDGVSAAKQRAAAQVVTDHVAPEDSEPPDPRRDLIDNASDLAALKTVLKTILDVKE